ncbi:MAG TPA: hypothetical protein VG498_12350 [Terriglobales bacterium]|nr:hypothetical protein [Terriglobales bacterium]
MKLNRTKRVTLHSSMDHHTVAEISIAGISLDVLGSLYLAYDLLGGQHGPLRLLTRSVTYSLVFGIGYGLGLGIFFGIVAGIATGITTSFELNRAARGLEHYSLPSEGLCSAIRGFAFGAGLYRMVGLGFALAFAILVTFGQIFAYSRGMRPAIDYAAARRPRLSRRQFWGTVIRTIGYIATALFCSTFIHHVDNAWTLALRVGLVTGVVTGIGATINPYIEYYADNLPERRLGAFGIVLILCGFVLQSLQYWLAVFDVRIR